MRSFCFLVFSVAWLGTATRLWCPGRDRECAWQHHHARACAIEPKCIGTGQGLSVDPVHVGQDAFDADQVFWQCDWRECVRLAKTKARKPSSRIFRTRRADTVDAPRLAEDPLYDCAGSNGQTWHQFRHTYRSTIRVKRADYGQCRFCQGIRSERSSVISHRGYNRAIYTVGSSGYITVWSGSYAYGRHAYNSRPCDCDSTGRASDRQEKEGKDRCDRITRWCGTYHFSVSSRSVVSRTYEFL